MQVLAPCTRLRSSATRGSSSWATSPRARRHPGGAARGRAADEWRPPRSRSGAGGETHALTPLNHDRARAQPPRAATLLAPAAAGGEPRVQKAFSAQRQEAQPPQDGARGLQHGAARFARSRTADVLVGDAERVVPGARAEGVLLRRRPKARRAPGEDGATGPQHGAHTVPATRVTYVGSPYQVSRAEARDGIAGPCWTAESPGTGVRRRTRQNGKPSPTTRATTKAAHGPGTRASPTSARADFGGAAPRGRPRTWSLVPLDARSAPTRRRRRRIRRPRGEDGATARRRRASRWTDSCAGPRHSPGRRRRDPGGGVALPLAEVFVRNQEEEKGRARESPRTPRLAAIARARPRRGGGDHLRAVSAPRIRRRREMGPAGLYDASHELVAVIPAGWGRREGDEERARIMAEEPRAASKARAGERARRCDGGEPFVGRRRTSEEPNIL